MTGWLPLTEQKFERRVIGPSTVALYLLAVQAGVFDRHWFSAVTFAVGAFFAGIIGASLEKNRKKTPAQLVRGWSADSTSAASSLSETQQYYAFFKTLALFATLCAALFVCIGIDFGRSWQFSVGAGVAVWFGSLVLAGVASMAQTLRSTPFSWALALVFGCLAAYTVEYSVEIATMMALNAIPSQPWSVAFYAAVAGASVFASCTVNTSRLPIALPCALIALLALQHGIRTGEDSSTYAGIATAVIGVICLWLVPLRFKMGEPPSAG